MEPLGYLILSNLPGQNRLKNLKYFLQLGDNVVGTDQRCQIVIPVQYQMMNHAVNICLGYNFVTVEALHSHLVYVQANLGKFRRENNSDNYFPLAANVKYLPKIGQFFYIGRIKAVIGNAGSKDLLQMKNIVNRQLFGLQPEKRELFSAQKRVQNRFESNQQLMKKDSDNFENTFNQVTLEDNDFNPFEMNNGYNEPRRNELASQNKSQRQVSERSQTQKLDNEQYQYEATLVLEEGIYANQPTINLDQCPFPVEYKNQSQISQNHLKQGAIKSRQNPNSQPFSQELLMQQIRLQSKSNSEHPQQNQDDGDFSMPDTIVDKEPEEHPFRASPKKEERPIKQVESREEGAVDDDSDQMPPTIQENFDAPPEPQRIKPTKTMDMNKKQKFSERLYRSDQVSLGNSLLSEPSEAKNIANFDELFGIEEQPQQLKHHSSLPVAEEKAEPSLGLMGVSLAIEEKKPSPEKQQAPEIKIKRRGGRGRRKNKDEEEEIVKTMVDIVGFKPTSSHRDYLNKQGYEIVASPHHDYSILIVKQPIRLCNKLLHALIQGKRIESDLWIFNKNSQIQSKIHSIAWKSIYQKKGTHDQLLRGKGRFFVSKRIEDLLSGVIEKMGGEQVDELLDKKKNLNIILRADDSVDTQLYLDNKSAKKWRFYRSQLIVDTVLTGRYSPEQKYQIRLFNDDS